MMYHKTKIWLYDEAGNYNSNSNSKQLSIKPCRFPLFKHYFSGTVANSFNIQLSIIISIIFLCNTTSPLNGLPLCHNERTSKQHSCTETSRLPLSVLSSMALRFWALIRRKQEKEKGYFPPQSKSQGQEWNMKILYSFHTFIKPVCVKNLERWQRSRKRKKKIPHNTFVMTSYRFCFCKLL